MFFMNTIQILDRDLALLLSLSLFSSLVTFLWSTSQVDYFSFAEIYHRLEKRVKGFEDLVFSFIHVAKIFH